MICSFKKNTLTLLSEDLSGKSHLFYKILCRFFLFFQTFSLKCDAHFSYFTNNTLIVMKKSAFIFACMMAFSQFCSAQHTVESIREMYNGQKEDISRMTTPDDLNYAEGMPPCYYKIYNVDNYPGTGPHREEVTFYFGEKEGAAEDLVFPPKCVTFVTAKYNFAAPQFYEEYLYDNKEKPIFLYKYMQDVSDEKEYELRVYLNNGKILKSITKERPVGSNENFKETYSGSNVPAKFIGEYNSLITRSNTFKKLFHSIDSATYK